MSCRVAPRGILLTTIFAWRAALVAVLHHILCAFVLLILVESHASVLAHACTMSAPSVQKLQDEATKPSTPPSCHEAAADAYAHSETSVQHADDQLCDCLDEGCSSALTVVLASAADQQVLPHHAEFRFISRYSFPSREGRFRPPSAVSLE